MLSSIFSRTFRKVIKIKMIPSTSRAASDCCHERCMAWHMVKAKNALRPILGAWAKGNLAIKGQQQRGDGRGQGRSRKERPLVHTGGRKDGWVDSKDVTHCQESGSASNNLRAHTRLGSIETKGFSQYIL